MIYNKALFVTGGLFGLLLTIAAVGPARSDDIGNEPLKTAAEAYQKAMVYTGFDRLATVPEKAGDDMVRAVVKNDTITPFLADSINGRTVWRIELTNIILDLAYSDAEEEAKYPKDITIDLDSATGRFFELRIRNHGEMPDSLYDYPADKAAREIKSVGGERYVGIPADMPKLTFLDVLNTNEYWGSPLTSKFTTVRYVLSSKVLCSRYTSEMRDEIIAANPGKDYVDIFASDTVAAWAFHMHGFPPINGPGQTHWRNVIDANTGEARVTVNLPGPR